MVRFHAALGMTWKQGVQAPRVDPSVYPRHVELITHGVEGIGNEPRLTRQDRVQ
jgi:hypothetical protein